MTGFVGYAAGDTDRGDVRCAVADQPLVLKLNTRLRRALIGAGGPDLLVVVDPSEPEAEGAVRRVERINIRAIADEVRAREPAVDVRAGHVAVVTQEQQVDRAVGCHREAKTAVREGRSESGVLD